MTRGEFYVRVLQGASHDHLLGLALLALGFRRGGELLTTRSLAPMGKPTAAQIKAARIAATQGGR